MDITLNKVSDVAYELEIDARAEELADEIKAALRRQRGQTQMKGFRPGKVPLGLVKKMHGEAIGFGIAEQKVQEAFRSEILEPDEYDVLGQPTLTTLDYELDGDLHAVVQFGVRPEVDLKDVSGETVSRLKREITDEDVDEQLGNLRRENAELVPAEDAEIAEDFHVVVDLQQIDEESGTPIIGEKEEDVEFFVDDERLHDDLRDGLLGSRIGDSFRVDLPHGEGDHQHTQTYLVTMKDAKRRELPELDDAFVGAVTKDEFVSLDELKENIRENLEEAWEQRSRELLDGRMVEKMLELHTVPVPESAVELYLDSFVEDVKQRNDGDLPEGFDEQAFRRANRGEAERQAKWMLIRDAFIEREEIDISDEELDAYFEEAAGQNEELSPQMIRQYYQSMNMIERVKQQLLSRKVFDRLAELFTVEDKDPDAFEEEVEALRKEKESAEMDRQEPSSIITPA
ncbi:MAG: trigger factor [Rhodothermales bacterium]